MRCCATMRHLGIDWLEVSNTILPKNIPLCLVLKWWWWRAQCKGYLTMLIQYEAFVLHSLHIPFNLSPVCIYICIYTIIHIWAFVKSACSFVQDLYSNRKFSSPNRDLSLLYCLLFPPLYFCNCPSFSLSFSPSFTFSLSFFHVLETVFLQPSLLLSPFHLCPVLRRWTWLPISNRAMFKEGHSGFNQLILQPPNPPVWWNKNLLEPVRAAKIRLLHRLSVKFCLL